jgi:hypothetical protein
MVAALALPGIQGAKADSLITKPQTDLQYTRYDEGYKRYQIDIYQGLLKIPLGQSTDLEVTIDQEMQAGPTTATYVPAAYYGLGSISTLVEARTEESVRSHRREVMIKPRFFGDDYHVGVHAIVSEEEDYESKTAGVQYTQDFNKVNTSLSAGYAYSDDAVKPTPQACGLLLIRKSTRSAINTHRFTVDLRQDLTTTTTIHAGLEFIANRGYLDDPYKVALIWGNALALRSETYYYGGPFGFDVTVGRDRRPNYRGTLGSSFKLIQHIKALDSTVHFGYRYIQNTWNIHSHTFTLEYYQQINSDFEIVPSVRYYAQNEAYFYAMAFDIQGGAPFPAKRIYGNEPASTDYRLARYGSFGGELKFNYKFLEDKSGKFTILMGAINRRNKFYWGRNPVLPNPTNEFKTYYGSIGMSFVF